MSSYIPVIGLEIHAELLTQSKVFVLAAQSSAEAPIPAAVRSAPVCPAHFR